MARDFEDLHDLDDLDDDELRELVRNHLAAHNALDIDDLDVRVENGVVYLDGRVGTDAERQVAEHVVTDVLGIQTVENGIFVDPTRRAASPEAIDEHLAEEDRTDGLMLGDRPVPLSPEVEQVAEDSDVHLYGTTDVQKSIESGAGWIPPESPTPEGTGGIGEFGEDH
jgi:hypothetical protein